MAEKDPSLSGAWGRVAGSEKEWCLGQRSALRQGRGEGGLRLAGRRLWEERRLGELWRSALGLSASTSCTGHR